MTGVGGDGEGAVSPRDTGAPELAEPLPPQAETSAAAKAQRKYRASGAALQRLAYSICPP